MAGTVQLLTYFVYSYCYIYIVNKLFKFDNMTYYKCETLQTSQVSVVLTPLW